MTIDWAAVATIITAIVGGVVTIVKVIYSVHDDSTKQGVARDVKIQEIHVLVNSKLVTVLRMLVVALKKEYDRTGIAGDGEAYDKALVELTEAESAARTAALLLVNPDK